MRKLFFDIHCFLESLVGKTDPQGKGRRKMSHLRKPHDRRCKWISVWLLSLAVIQVSPTSAAAASGPTNKDQRRQKRAKAKKVFEDAEKAYNLARFKKALKLYSAAYELLPMAGFLFNI